MANKNYNNVDEYLKDTTGKDSSGMTAQQIQNAETDLSAYKQKNLLQETYDSAIDELDAQKKAQEKQSYFNNAKLMKYLPQNLKAQGLSGLGVSQTAQIEANNNYMNQLASITSDYNKNKTSLSNDLAKNQLQVDESIRQEKNALNQYWQNRQDAIDAEQRGYDYQDKVRQEGYARDDKLIADERTYNDKVRDEDYAYQDKVRSEGYAHDITMQDDAQSHDITMQDDAQQFTTDQIEAEGKANHSSDLLSYRTSQLSQYASQFETDDKGNYSEEDLSKIMEYVEKNNLKEGLSAYDQALLDEQLKEFQTKADNITMDKSNSNKFTSSVGYNYEVIPGAVNDMPYAETNKRIIMESLIKDFGSKSKIPNGYEVFGMGRADNGKELVYVYYDGQVQLAYKDI